MDIRARLGLQEEGFGRLPGPSLAQASPALCPAQGRPSGAAPHSKCSGKRLGFSGRSQTTGSRPAACSGIPQPCITEQPRDLLGQASGCVSCPPPTSHLILEPNSQPQASPGSPDPSGNRACLFCSSPRPASPGGFFTNCAIREAWVSIYSSSNGAILFTLPRYHD